MKTTFFSLIACLFVFCAGARAGILQATVTQIRDARTVTAVAAGRPVTVELEAIDVPRADEPFAAIAKQHLTDLIIGKNVAVEYTGIAAGGRLLGKIVSKQIDIGQQMIRDGVARYSKELDADLSSEERELYLAAEDAAHKEKRGIWQDGVLPSPGVWRRAAANLTQTPVVASPSPAPENRRPAPSSIFPSYASDDQANRTLDWPMFTPPGAPFKGKIPSGGYLSQFQIPLKDGESTTANIYFVNHPRILYIGEWFSAVKNNPALESDYEEYLSYVMDALHRQGYGCELMSSNEVTSSGYHGRSYRISGCALHGGIKLFHKYSDHHLKVLVVGAVSEDVKSTQAEQFMNSLVLNP